MRWTWIPVWLLLCHALVASAYEDSNLEDDDFAEFEQFDAEDDIADIVDFKEETDDAQSPPKERPQEPEFQKITEDDILVEDEDNEFEHFQDPEEFEGYADAPLPTQEQPKITISKMPITARLRWDAYWLEGILCVLLTAYAASYAVGRAKNSTIAYEFLKRHKPLLDDNFTLVGETGSDVSLSGEERGWRREAEHCYSMWCSGRLCCEGMLLTLKLIKRQDLVHVVLGMFRPSPDTLQIRIELSKDDCDPFVLCVGQKKIVTRLAKEMQDLSVFCPEKRPGDKHGLPATMAVLSECAEATAGVLDARVTNAISLYSHRLQYIHISDTYCGPKQMEGETSTKPPETERVMLVSFALGDAGSAVEDERPLLLLVFYILDKLRRLRLSKEALAKCEKRRQKVSELWQRGAHAARQEQAAARREEKRKQEKERILAEDDPEKQRRWELKEQKRQMKKKTPKMKQLKVKAL